MRFVVLSILLTLTAPAVADDLKPVTIDVVDADTGKSIPQFRYQYQIETADRKGDVDRQKWLPYDVANGKLRLQAPASCEITLGVRAADYIGGFGRTHQNFQVRTADGNRTFV